MHFTSQKKSHEQKMITLENVILLTPKPLSYSDAWTQPKHKHTELLSNGQRPSSYTGYHVFCSHQQLDIIMNVLKFTLAPKN